MSRRFIVGKLWWNKGDIKAVEKATKGVEDAAKKLKG